MGVYIGRGCRSSQQYLAHSMHTLLIGEGSLSETFRCRVIYHVFMSTGISNVPPMYPQTGLYPRRRDDVVSRATRRMETLNH